MTPKLRTIAWGRSYKIGGTWILIETKPILDVREIGERSKPSVTRIWYDFN